MDSILQHRLLLLACIVAGCALLWPFTGEFLPADRSAGFTLAFAHQGFAHATGLFALLTVPLTLLALLASASGNVLSGAFMIGTSLAIFAARFGPADGLLLRANLPNDYKLLLLETASLAVIFLAAGTVLTAVTPKIKTAFPNFARLRETAPDANSNSGSERTTLAACLQALVLTAGIAALLLYFLASGSSPKQTLGAIVTAFALGAIASQLIVGKPGTLGTLLAPIPLALAAYAYPLVMNLSPHAVTQGWFNGQLPSLCKILPICYLAAGPLGAVVGHALSHAPSSHDAAEKENAAADSTVRS